MGPGSHVLEIGAGLGSLTFELARSGAEVVAVEVDRRLAGALEEASANVPNIRVVVADATKTDWSRLLRRGEWVVVANLPYNVSVPVVMRILNDEPRVHRMLVMVQREVGERLAAGPGEPRYGAVSVRVAYRATARVVRPVARTVFWPPPGVDSVLVAIVRRPPPVAVDEQALWRTIEVAFAQRRKTMRSALIRLGLDPDEARRTLDACGISPMERPERLDVRQFACLAKRRRRAAR